MPMYEYLCKSCSKDYTYFHLGSQDKTPKCPHCASSDAEKQVSKETRHILKGGGWARDNYGAKPKVRK